MSSAYRPHRRLTAPGSVVQILSEYIFVEDVEIVLGDLVDEFKCVSVHGVTLLL